MAAAVGLFASAYPAIVDLGGASSVYVAGGDCDVVRGGVFGSLLGVLLAVWGLPTSGPC